MPVDYRLVVAELRAGDLLCALQAAVNGNAHWRLQARILLDQINDLYLPPAVTEKLREIDGRKRAMEMAEDLVCEEMTHGS